MDTLISIANYLDEMDEIIVNSVTEYFDESRLNELRGLLTDAFNNMKNVLTNDSEITIFGQMRNHFINRVSSL